MKTPNLFNYATSELSQDAFILWLLDWANPQYKDADEQLNAAAQKFVRFLLDKNKNDLQIESVKCYKQLKNIDVLAIVNNVFAILIEDKTDTSEHDNQLTNYTQWLKNEGKKILNIENEPELHCIYYKTGNESYYYLNKLEKKYKNDLEKKYKNDHSNVAFKILLRSDILNVLKEVFPSSLNPIFIDYVNHLQRIEKQTQSYTKKSVSEWGSRAWQGFYMALENCLNEKLTPKEEDKLTLCKWVNDPYNDAWDFKLPKFSINEDDSIKLYLQIDSKNGCLSIRTYCNPKKTQDKGWSKPVKKTIYAESFVNKLNEIKLIIVRPERIAESENTTFAYIRNTDDSHFVSGEAIKVDTIADRLLELQSLIAGLASTLRISQQKQ
ncbi:MAG: hypothetical protein K5660_03870 [Paludibacteraceae bacterium]|nr:hypothetical protein [Paludibacteraceae bacterium]